MDIVTSTCEGAARAHLLRLQWGQTVTSWRTTDLVIVDSLQRTWPEYVHTKCSLNNSV